MAKEPDEMRRRYSFDEDGDVGTAGRAARVQDDTPRPAELWQFADDTLARNLHHLESVVDALYRRLAPVMSHQVEKAEGASRPRTGRRACRKGRWLIG